MEPELLDEVFQEALQHLDRQAQRASRSPLELPDDLLMAKMDARLIVQVIINIVNNAVKYTPPGSAYRICGPSGEGDMVAVAIADDGPGIPDEAKEQAVRHVLHRQQRAGRTAAAGWGWACRCASPSCTAHGGTITVRDNQPARHDILPLHCTAAGGELP